MTRRGELEALRQEGVEGSGGLPDPFLYLSLLPPDGRLSVKQSWVSGADERRERGGSMYIGVGLLALILLIILLVILL